MIVAVSVLLWLVYLVPSWYERRQYDAAERNAVRLNQALRVLAETSETPDEVRLELTTRTAQAQQREAKRALAERERLAKLAAAEREQAAVEEARSELVAARSLPAARRARARRRARLLTTIVGLVAVAFLGWGSWLLATTGSQTLLWWSAGILAVCAAMLVQMARVSARAAVRSQVTVKLRCVLPPPYRMLRSPSHANGRRVSYPSPSLRHQDPVLRQRSTVWLRARRCGRPHAMRRCVSGRKLLRRPLSTALALTGNVRGRRHPLLRLRARQVLQRDPISGAWVTSTTPRLKPTSAIC